MSRLTILDVLKQKSDDGVIPMVEEAALSLPELRVMAAAPIKGTSYKTLVRTSLPQAKFRSANEGVDVSKAGYINRRVEAFAINPRFECDELVALEHPRGVAGALADEGMAQTEASWEHAVRQLYLGLANDAKGFPGYPDVVHAGRVLDIAGGTAGQRTSVWGVRFGDTNCRFVLGHDGKFGLEDPRKETLYDENDKPFDGWVQSMLGFVGLQVASIDSLGRIKGLTKDSGKELTDDVIAQWLAEKWRPNKWPHAMFMNMQSLEQLRNSRTATNPAGTPAPFPDSAFNIPIYPSEAIPIGETV